MKKILTLCVILLYSALLQAQVGINNTDPKASLDISATNQANPANTDGLLIPRIDDFPATNPTSAQQGMMVYLTTTSGGNPPGFYYWDNNAGPAAWVSVVGVEVQKLNDLTDAKSDDDGSENGSSVFIGIGAGSNDDVTDNKNIGIGKEALTNNTTGYLNTAIGYQSLIDNTIGHNNTAVGAYSLSNNTSGNYNTANGDSALYNNTSGERNTALGRSSLFFNTTGNDNASVGYLSLSDNTTGIGNTAMGSSSLNNNTTGSNNAVLGYNTLANNTTGSHNTAIGQAALVSNTTGTNNNALGRGALASNTTGDLNTAIGLWTLYDLTNGQNNSVLGSYALQNNTTGSNNVAIGYQSGNNNINGSNNLFIGNQSGFLETGSNKLYIENSNANTDNALVYGEFGTDNSTTGNKLRTNGEFQIGNPTGTGYAFPTIDGTSGQVLQTDGSGQLSFSSIDSSDHDWYEVGTTDPPNNIYDNKFTQGNVGIGHDTPLNVPLYVYNNSNINLASAGIVLNRYHSNTTSSGNGGINAFTDLQAGSTGWYYNIGSSLQSQVDVGGSMFNYRAVNNVKSGGSQSSHYLYYGLFSTNTGSNSNAKRFGSYIGYSTNTTSTGDKYGHYTTIPSSISGTHYGMYSDVTSASGYAGYFLGRTSFGTATSNRYLMPTADGTLGQVITTDGSGQLTFSSIPNDDDWTTVGSDIERQSGNVYIGDTNTTDNDLYISDRIIDWDDSTYFLNPDDVSRVDEIQFDLGSVSDPSIRFTTTDSGFYSPSNAVTAYSASGTEAFRISSSGDISIGSTNTLDYKLLVETPGLASQIFIGAKLNNNDIVRIVHESDTGDGLQVNVNSSYTLASRSAFTGVNNYPGITTNIARYTAGSRIYGVENNISGSLSLPVYGVYNFITNSGASTQYGTHNRLLGTGNGIKYGSYNFIADTAGGTHYGVFSNIQKGGSYAGYFLGRVSIGTLTTDNYIFPSSRGTNGQVMQTDGSGNISWVSPSTGDITGVIAGDGLTGGGATGNITLNIVATNGLTDTANNIKLGGSLTEDTSITYGTYDTRFNLNSTGDFIIQDNGFGTFAVLDDGTSIFGDDTYWRNGNISGTILAGLTSFSDDGVFEIYQGGSIINRFHGNGSSYINAGNLGIGTTTPDYKFSVNGTANLNEDIASGIALRVNGDEALWYNGTYFSWGFGGSANYFADEVGIGTNSPSYKLDVRNTLNNGYVAQIYNTNTSTTADGLRINLGSSTPDTGNFFIGFYGDTTIKGRITGDGVAGTVYNTTSDGRLKKNIEDISHSLKLIEKIKPRKYEYKIAPGIEEYGFIAQELQPLYPQAVSGSPDSNVETDPMMVDYSRLTPLLTAGIKELNEKVKNLENENQQLKETLSKYEALEKRLSILENNSNKNIDLANH